MFAWDLMNQSEVSENWDEDNDKLDKTDKIKKKITFFTYFVEIIENNLIMNLSGNCYK